MDASSKIKFSRSLPLMVPNAKRVSRSTFIVQIEVRPPRPPPEARSEIAAQTQRVLIAGNGWQDPSLDFEGDSGVVGTIKSSESSLHLDVKGQLYEVCLLSTCAWHLG